MRYNGYVGFTLKVENHEVPKSIREKFKNASIYSVETTSEVRMNRLIDCSAISKTEALEKVKTEFFSFCQEKDIKPIGALTTKVELSTLMNTHNSHNGDLVDKINYIWQTELYDDSLKSIATALYERDIEECNDKNIFISEYQNDLYGFLYEMFMHVCDDEDLEVVINFVRARTPKGQIIWANSDAWEE